MVQLVTIMSQKETLDYIQIPKNICKSCGYVWVSIRLAGKKPKRCPQCQSYNWDKAPDAKQAYHQLQELYGRYLAAYNPRLDGGMLTMREWRERHEAERLERKRARLAEGGVVEPSEADH